VPLVRASTAVDPLSRSSVARAPTSPATVNGVVPSVAWPAAQDRLVILGCRVLKMVAVMARAATAQVPLVATVPWASTKGVVPPPLVRSCGGDGATDEKELGVEEPSVEELCVEKPSGFW
jgi:hypothetical protein